MLLLMWCLWILYPILINKLQIINSPAYGCSQLKFNTRKVYQVTRKLPESSWNYGCNSCFSLKITYPFLNGLFCEFECLDSETRIILIFIKLITIQHNLDYHIKDFSQALIFFYKFRKTKWNSHIYTLWCIKQIQTSGSINKLLFANNDRTWYIHDSILELYCLLIINS